MTKLFGVAGKPVMHSMSPQMHNAAFMALGIDARYVRLAAESAEDALGTAREMGMKGLNVTSPFKEDMAALAGAADEGARRLGAVNTVVLGSGRPEGYNSDVGGVALALKSNGVEIRGKKAVVLGAGGAAKAAALALMNGGASVAVANRTLTKAERIAGELGCGFCGMEDVGEALGDSSVLVSALSTGERVVPPEALHEGLAVLDANYSTETSLSLDAKRRCCKVIDGREWLLYQGARAFEIFTGKEAPAGEMRKAIYGGQDAGGKTQKKGSVALIGMMGSGKDTVAKELGGRTGKPVRSVDSMVERSAGKEISRIFDEKGEEGFRELERAELDRALAEGGIINCGGGAVLDARNREAIRKGAVAVWLFADAKTLASRVPQDGKRPLLKGEDAEKKLGEVLAARLGKYAEASDIVVDTGRSQPQKTAERILYEIH
ncbi:MAG: shikimate kinase [Candidatus Micrarchaeota archaeon]